MHNFLDITYLKNGNELQQNVYHLLKTHRVLEILNEYQPIVVGTIPIEINIENSDIDIVGEAIDFDKAESYLIEQFSTYTDFKINQQISNNKACLTCNFFIESFEIEIYLEHKKPTEQNAYRHMLIEAQVLEKFGKEFKNNIIQLKKNGYKTEPAFAKLLHLQGDPYAALLEYKIN